MATQTTNYNLTKPALTDSPPDITVLNGNFDIIDNLLKALSDKFFIADSNTTAAQIEAAYLAGRKIMAIINGVLYPSMIRNGENNYIFATEVPTGDNNANTSMLYRKITSSGWDSTPYQRDLVIKTDMQMALASKAGLPKRYEIEWIEIESGTNAGHFTFSDPEIDYNKAILLTLNSGFSARWGETTQNRCLVTRNTGSGTVNVGVLLIEFN